MKNIKITFHFNVEESDFNLPEFQARLKQMEKVGKEDMNTPIVLETTEIPIHDYQFEIKVK